MKRRHLLVGSACALGAMHVGGAQALRIVVAYPPGGISDSVARVLARQLDPILSRPVIVENRPGAGGSLALSLIANAAPDGNTLGFCAISPVALSPHFGNAGASVAPNVAPVSGVMHTPLLLVATSAMAARSFADTIRDARATPGQLRWATSGVGTIGHLALEQVNRQYKLDVVHVPYTGGAPQLQDALAGRFELLSTNLAPLQIDYVRAGKLHALAVGAPARSQVLADVPTFAELGCPAANLSSLFGVFAPPATPAAVVAHLNAACAQVLRQPVFRQLLASGGNLPADGSAADFASEIARQSEANARLVAAMRVR
ncbi:tripartite tricarboxylate transporter substrate binding protein [Caenimonas koreensis]|uniref:Tripartite tricarboxylate transporter substrate binding protein n=1 Tax=Caenimonas koreensis DSM 17982 TaxID=1121255 RepID=A0A844AVH8_9BURK|nr:tripartite tricarboxylate transporter substrate binding protein [Caenimonas koreensis]MRD46388.1 tripartite tricarboxylate transporter substrate binding protein [Caenimonas koreensis DSM 17982]